MFSKSNNFTQQYLSDYDLITKYCLTNLYSKPKIKSICITFPLKNIYQAFEESNNAKKNINLQVKSILFIYLFSTVIPFINNKVKISKTGEKEMIFMFKIKITNKIEIYQFLISLCVENFMNLLNSELSLKSIFTHTPVQIAKTSFNYKISVPASIYFELSNNLFITLLGINPKEILMNFHFKIISSLKKMNTQKLLQNLPLFWIND